MGDDEYLVGICNIHSNFMMVFDIAFAGHVVDKFCFGRVCFECLYLE